MIHIIANGFGVLSTLCFIASFQVKSNKGLYLIQSVANVFYGIQFYLLGATGGLFNMGMQIVRNLLLCKKEEWKWLQHPAMAPLLCVPSLIYMIVQLAGSAAVHRDDGGDLRLLDRQREETPHRGTVRGITSVDDLRPDRGSLRRRAE